MEKDNSFSSFSSKRNILISCASYLALPPSHSNWLQSLSFHLSHLQITIILLQLQTMNLTIDSTRGDLMSNYLKRIVHKLSFIQFFKENYENWIYSSVLVCLWIYLSTIVALLAFIGINGLRGHSILQRIRPFLVGLLQLHAKVIFWISIMILMVPCLASDQLLGHLSSLNINNDTLTIINIPFMIISYLIAGIASLFCITYLKGESQFAVYKSFDQSSSFLFKALLTILIPLSTQRSAKMMIFVINLLISLTRHYCLWKDMPYYEYRTMKTSLIWSSLECWMTIINIFLTLFQQNFSKFVLDILYFEIILAPFLVKITISCFDRIVEKYSRIPTHSLRNRRETFIKLLSLNRLIASGNNYKIRSRTFKLHFLGGQAENSIYSGLNWQKTSSFFGQDCDSCNKVSDDKQDFENFSKTLCYNIIKEAAQKIKNSSNIKILLVGELCKSKESQPGKALRYLHNFIPEDSAFFIRVKRNILLEKISKKLENCQSQHELNIKRFVDFHNDKRFCTDLLLSNVGKFIDFWLYYNQPNFKLKEILRKSVAIEEEADKIERIFEFCMKKHPELRHTLGKDYCKYLVYVRNLPSSANTFSKKYPPSIIPQHDDEDLPFSLIREENYNLHDSMTLYVSLSKKKGCKIFFASVVGSNVLGYTPRELFDMDVNILLSPLIGEKHTQLVNEYFLCPDIWNEENSHKSICYIRDREGFIIPCSIDLKIFPYIQEDLVYVCILKPNKTRQQYIIFTEDGLIEGESREVGLQLNLFPNNVNYLRDICNDLPLVTLRSSKEFKFEKLDSYFKYENSSEFVTLTKSTALTLSTNLNSTRPSHRKSFVYDVKLTPSTILDKKFYIMILKNGAQVHTDDFVSEIPDEVSNLIEEKFNIEIDQDQNRKLLVPITPKRSKRTDKRLLTINERASLPLNTLPLELLLSPIHSEMSNRAMLFQGIGDSILETKEPLKATLCTEILNTQEDKNFKKLRTRLDSVHGQIKMTFSEDTSHNARNQIEQGIYSVPSKRLIKSINIVVGIYLVICGICLFIFGEKSQDCYAAIEQNTEILKLSTYRLFMIVLLERNLVYRSLLNNNLIKNDRLYEPYGIANFLGDIPLPIVREKTLNGNNTNLRKLVDGIDIDLQRQIYSYMVPMKENNETMYKNIFDAAVELTLKTKKLIVNPVYQTQKDSPPINFVLQNGFDEILVGSEAVSDIILKDSDKKLDKVVYLAFYILIIIATLELFLVGLLISEQMDIVKTRNRLINLFLTVRDEDINEVLTQVIAFEKSLCYTHTKIGHNSKNEVVFNNYSRHRRERNSFRQYRKEVSYQGLNFNQIMITCSSILLSIIILIPFLRDLLMTKSKQTFLNNKMGAIVEINTHVYESALLQTSFCSYVTPQGSRRLRAKPFEEEWEAIFQKRLKMNSYLFQLLNTLETEDVCDDTSLQSIRELFTANFCEMFPTKSKLYQCSTIGGGAMNMGLTRMVTYMLTSLKGMKEYYDNSDKTPGDIEKAIDSIENIHTENILSIWHLDAFTKLNKIIAECDKKEITKVQESLKIESALYLLLFVVITILVSLYWKKLLETEYNGWRKLMRKIPLDIVIASKVLSNYAQQDRVINMKIKSQRL